MTVAVMLSALLASHSAAWLETTLIALSLLRTSMMPPI